MLIKSKQDDGNEAIIVHVVELSLRLPKLSPSEIGQATLETVLKEDALLLANRIKNHLDSRKSIKAVTISSAYGTAKFTAITPESIFGSPLMYDANDRIPVEYIVSTVDPDTGIESKPSKFTVTETGWEDKTCAIEVCFAANYYKAAYIMTISDEMKTKNPGGYYTIKRNFVNIGNLPYLSAPLSEQVIGYVEGVGYYFANLYPIPGSVIENLSVQDYPHLHNLHGVDKTPALIESIIINPESVDLTSVLDQLRESELGHISSGLTNVFQIAMRNNNIPISERLTGHLINQRQNLIWCFSELSRFFELAGIINNSSINKNMKTFQSKIKSLSDSRLESALFPDSAPRDLEDFIIQLFPSKWKPIYKMLKQIDPNRILYDIEYISGDMIKFNRFKGANKFLSPGLILTVPYLNQVISIESQGDDELPPLFSYGDLKFKLTPLTTHSSDVISHKDYNSIKSDVEVYNDLIALVNIVFWLNTEESDKFLLNKDTPGIIQLITPTHLARKYSNIPFFSGVLRARVLKGLI